MTTRPLPRPFAHIELLEARIAPALVLANPLPDLVAGPGKTGAAVDLSELFDPAALYPHRTLVEFTTNVDIDTTTPGLQAGKIVLELFDELAPLTVQNFLGYVTSKSAAGDYDNTFFHRAGRGFVLQGGGFEKFGTHIPVMAPVHNEPDAVNRSNVLGTVAMAKVGGDPNSATSEWFVNLGNNTGLDTQNGGFTVFGRVIQGLDLATSISQLPFYNAGGDGTGTPTQNGYNSDPDNNPSTPAPLPTGDQLVRIVDAKVVPSTGASAGVIFSLESIVPVGSAPAKLVTGAISGQALNLKYAASGSGFVDVTVKATEAGSEPVFDTFRVDLRPNLIVDIASDGFQGVIIPGDTATVKLNVINTGGGSANGPVDIQLGLIKTVATRNSNNQITGFVVDGSATPITLAKLEGVTLNLADGKTASFTIKAKIPNSGLAPEDPAADIEGTVYQLVAQIVPIDGADADTEVDIKERFPTDDNTDQLARQHHALNRFGTFTSGFSGLFGGRKDAKLTYLDDRGTPDVEADDTLVTWSLNGIGSGRVSLTPSGGVAVETDGTDAKSALGVQLSEGGRVAIEGIQLRSAIGSANLGAIDLDDYLFAPGGVKSLTLGDVNGPATILLNPLTSDFTTKTTLKFGRVLDLHLESGMPIAALTAIDWRDTAGTDHDALKAIGLGTLKITGAAGVRGDFEADLTIDDSAPVSSLSIAGFLRNSTIRTAGNLGTVTLGGSDTSNVFVGVSERPDSLADFGDALTLSNFTIKGIKGFIGDLFTDSQVAAATLGTVKLTGVATASGDSDFGFVANAIKSYNRTGVKTASNVTLPTVVEDQENFVVQVL